MGKDDTYVPEINFTSFVLTLSSSAWVSLGKIADPMSGEVKKDLQGAKFTIDALIMLRVKTRGNLSEDEQKVLDGLIADLQANFAETFFVAESTAGEEKAESKKSEKDKADTITTAKSKAEEGKSEKGKRGESKEENAKGGEETSQESKSQGHDNSAFSEQKGS